MQEPAVIQIQARLDRASVDDVRDELAHAMRDRPSRVVLDLENVQAFDSAGMGAVVESVRAAREQGVEVKLRGLSRPMLDFFSLLSVDRLLTRVAPSAPRQDVVRRVGAAVEPLLATVGGICATAAQTAHAVFVAPWRGKRLRIDRTVAELDMAAAGALPIVALISFLLGLILAMQAYVQLRVWGAEIYMADMVGVSVMTEIGPLMTAIILAARSGSSNAAQLGSMVVSEEIDALKQMGIHPIRYLVAPKVVALAMAVAMLTLLFDLIAMAGGALFGLTVAGIEIGAYQEQTQQALRLSDFFVAVGKSIVFGGCIGVVGCSLGLRVEGGSEGVGRATTEAVVVSIFLIIVIDALFVTAQRMVFA